MAKGRMRLEYVPLDEVVKWPRNPKSHDLGEIHRSMDRFGFVAPVIRDEKTGRLVAGHGRLAALTQKRANGEHPPARVDVDDNGQWLVPVITGVTFKSEKEASAYLIADNRLVQMGGWNDGDLADMLKALAAEDGGLTGIGFDGDDVDSLVRRVESEGIPWTPPSADVNAVTGAPVPSAMAVETQAAGTPRAGLVRPDVSKDETVNKLAEAPPELAGTMQLKEDVLFPTQNPWGIPDLRRDMLLEKLPNPTDTWANQYVTPDDGVTSWFYNYEASRSAGLPWDRAILSFFTHDQYFENWWHVPAHYTSKMLNVGLRMAVVPDFSLWADDPLALQLFNVYRAQWMGRYFQEAGIKVIPRVTWSVKESFDFCLLGIPKNPPVVAVQIQTFDKNDNENVERARYGLQESVRRLEPETLLLYSGTNGQALLNDVDLGDTKVVTLPTVWQKVNAQRKAKGEKLLPDVVRTRGSAPSKLD